MVPDWLQDILKLLAGGVLVLLGQLVSFLRSRWKVHEDRKTSMAEKRRPVYAKALVLIFETGNNLNNEDVLFRIVHEWEIWIPANAAYLSPDAIDILYQLMNATGIMAVNLSGHNVSKESRLFFD